MNRTKIEWVKNPDGTQGYTWNPITGCLNGCPYCYARKLANGRLRQRYLANDNVAIKAFGIVYIDGNDPKYKDPFYPRFWIDRLYEPCQKEKPVGIFPVDMGELFGDWVPKEWQDLIFSVIEATPQHRYYPLTKQPQNLIKWSPFPENCWVGVTVTTNGDMTRALTNLASISASVRYLSIEPLLGYIGMNDHMNIKGIIDWLIIGCQTKPLELPKRWWVDEIIEAGDNAGIPIFVKPPLSEHYGINRQEFPK